MTNVDQQTTNQAFKQIPHPFPELLARKSSENRANFPVNELSQGPPSASSSSPKTVINNKPASAKPSVIIELDMENSSSFI